MSAKELTFEQSMEQLETIVSQLERGELPLEEALKSFEKGSKLVQTCQTRLNDAQMRIEKVTFNDEVGEK